MNTAEKYIYRVYIEKSFSKAAKALFVSQPSLSAAIARKEEELGFSVFDRSTKPITLTAQGQIYAEMLEEMHESEQNMLRRLQKLSGADDNAVAIGGNSTLAYYLMPRLVSAFHRRFPETQIKIDVGHLGIKPAETERFSLFQKLDQGVLDALFVYDYNKEKYDAFPVTEERLTVALHKSFLTEKLAPFALTCKELLCRNYSPEKEIKEKGFFDGIPFLTFPKSSGTAHLMAELLGDHTSSPSTVANSFNGIMHLNLMLQGMGAFLTGDRTVALSGIPCEDVRFFVFEKQRSVREAFCVTKKNAHRHKSFQNFLAVIKEESHSHRLSRWL